MLRVAVYVQGAQAEAPIEFDKRRQTTEARQEAM